MNTKNLKWVEDQRIHNYFIDTREERWYTISSVKHKLILYLVQDKNEVCEQ